MIEAYKICWREVFGGQAVRPEAATYKHLMFWALWDTASFCVDNRLRTPLGSNKDTLGSINRAIGDFERQLSAKKVDDTKESTQILLSRPRMFFHSKLGKVNFQCVRGFSLPAASKQVRTFNNRRTCQMWLRGLRAKFRKSLSKFKSTSALFPSAIGRGRMPSWLQMLSALNQAQSSILKRFTKNRVMTKRENHSWINYQNEHGDGP